MQTTQLETPCREWQGARVAGYGVRKINGKMVKIHRWAVAQVHGWDAIKGKVVMHRCDNPACFRYSHLEIGTNADNVRDMHAKGRAATHCSAAITECKRGHAYTEENTYTDKAGKRSCKTCRRAAEKRWAAEQKANP